VNQLGATAKTEVNAEVVDAINVDTYSEIGQGAPPATATPREMWHYLYKTWRNKVTTDGSGTSIYDNSGTTVDQKNTISDDGSTFTKGEFGSG
jgi:hypothetical protein